MLKVVFDTVVFVRSLINPHGRWGPVVFAHSRRYRLFLSYPILPEILEVLSRPELTSKFRSLENMDIAKVIEIIGLAEVVEVPQIPDVSRDSKDNKFLATSEAAEADYLVSEDKDLLILKEYKGVKIIDTERLLQILEQGEEEAGPQ